MRRLFEGNYLSGSSWDDTEDVVMEFDIENEGELWTCSSGNAIGEPPTIHLNLKELAKQANLNEEETKMLFDVKEYCDDSPVEFASFTSEGYDDGYDWDGPCGGGYHDVFKIVSCPTYKNIGMEDAISCVTGEDEAIAQSLMEKLKKVDYVGNIYDWEYDESDTF